MSRRKVLLFFTSLLVLSNLLVAIAPNMMMVLLARMLLGIALGGFWALAAATIMRLVAKRDVPKAMEILVAGVSAATVFAALKCRLNDGMLKSATSARGLIDSGSSKGSRI